MKRFFSIAVIIVLTIFSSGFALAKIDAAGGPAAQAARKALETGNINYALIWVHPQHEAKFKKAFNDAIIARKNSPQIVDEAFCKMVVDLHREGENIPLDTQPTKAIATADAAIDTKNFTSVKKMIIKSIETDLEKRFQKVLATAQYDTNDVAAGREHIKAYVSFVHYVDHLYDSVQMVGKFG